MKISSKKEWSFATKLIHSGEEPDLSTGAMAPILVRSKTYAQADFGKESKYQYSRGANPTRQKLEEKLADLEGGGFATVYGSGVGAVANFLFTLSPLDHVIFCNEIYGGTYRLLEKVFSKYSIKYDFVDFQKIDEVEKHINSSTKYFFIETPTNPSLHIIDLKAVQNLSKKTGIPYVVDATFAPPCATRHFEYGAHTIIHSLSKYIAGHNDVIAGAIITRDKKLYDNLSLLNRTIGAILSPDECYRVLQEVKTLDLRWSRSSETALSVAHFLQSSKKIEKVLYPGLPSHIGHDIASRQTKNGYGSVISFVLKEKSQKKLKKFIDAIRENSPIVYGESLASPETIISYPPLMSHKSLPTDIRESLGIGDGFFRISIGLEDKEDIIRGLREGLKLL